MLKKRKIRYNKYAKDFGFNKALAGFYKPILKAYLPVVLLLHVISKTALQHHSMHQLKCNSNVKFWLFLSPYLNQTDFIFYLLSLMDLQFLAVDNFKFIGVEPSFSDLKRFTKLKKKKLKRFHKL